MAKKLVLDIEKLWEAFENKRKPQGTFRGLSRDRIALRYGLAKSSLNFGEGRSKELKANTLFAVLDFLGRPHTDFVKELEVSENGSGIKTNRSDSG